MVSQRCVSHALAVCHKPIPCIVMIPSFSADPNHTFASIRMMLSLHVIARDHSLRCCEKRPSGSETTFSYYRACVLSLLSQSFLPPPESSFQLHHFLCVGVTDDDENRGSWCHLQLAHSGVHDSSVRSLRVYQTFCTKSFR